MRKASRKEVSQAMTEGIVFHPQREKPEQKRRVKTKAKGKAYITGAHGSDSAKMKAGIRQRRAQRPSQRPKD